MTSTDDRPLSDAAQETAALPHALRRGPIEAAGLGFLFLYSSFGTVGILLGVVHAMGGGSPKGPALFLLRAVAAAAAAGATISVTRPVAVLFPDRIETPGVIRNRVLHRVNIAKARRLRRIGGGRALRLVSASRTERSVNLPAWAARDPVAVAWLGPHGPAEAQPGDGGAAASRPAPPPAFARAIGLGLIAAGGGLALWLLLRPLDGVGLVVAGMALLGGCALAVGLERRFAWAPGVSGRAPLFGAALPAAAISLRQAATSPLSTPLLLWALAAVAGVAAGAAVWRRRRAGAGRRRLALGAGLAATALAYGTVSALDVGLDGGRGTVSPAVVVEHAAGRWAGATGWRLRLSPPPPGGPQVRVSRRLWQSTFKGQIICVARHPGALGLAWRRIDLCPELEP